MLSEKIQPRFNETDFLGHINNTVLPVWFEAARLPIFEIFTPDLAAAKWQLMVAKLEVTFLGELFYGQEVEIKTTISHIGNSSFVVKQQAWQHQQCCAEGHTVMVKYNFNTKKSQPLNSDDKAALSKHLSVIPIKLNK